MDLSTTYLGLELPHPFMPGASPLTEDLDSVRRLEDAGASAIVLGSLFEEQLVGEEMATRRALDASAELNAEATSYFPDPDDFRLGPDDYLDHLQRVKEAVGVPVIASLNGTTTGGWLRYADLMQEAGADALELNLYALATDPSVTSAALEDSTLALVRSLKGRLKIPLAVKLSPFYTSLASFAQRLDQIGVEGVVIFNRFYQPDIDIEALEVARTLELSRSSELRLRLRWAAILSSQVRASIAITGGVHTAEDALKAVMAGASAVQMVSALLDNGPKHLERVRAGVETWLVEHEYESLRQALGSMNHSRSPDPAAFERANYMHILAGWRPD
ncbi:MAG: dihydroorotate dehydrogenase-like protein [Planctomycetes bacterium]|nr:dihydroorotate dehydrogenase-like protein [Planctomycetota bacterium]